MNLFRILSSGDAVTVLVSMLLLAMSIASWVVIFWKGWLLRRARTDVAASLAAFWQSLDLAQAQITVKALDREQLVLPLIAATQADAVGTLAGSGATEQQLTRRLRDALHHALHKLQFGQILLATVGSTAPFVGLLGTVWGIYHALISITGNGQITIDKVSAPVGEALLMTAAGLAVAIPAVLAYNVLGRLVTGIEADLEGFALDLRDLLSGVSTRQS